MVPLAVPFWKDNYAWLVPTGHDTFAAVDPGDAAPVIATLESRGARLSHLLVTHHHADHVGGVGALVERYQPEVVGAARDQERLPPLGRAVSDGETFRLGEAVCRVLEVPGHTLGHVAYVLGEALFCGDVLFSMGCGRVFEGTPDQMWESLRRLRALPDATRMCCGHEYTAANLEFSLHVLPGHEGLLAYRERALRALRAGRPTLPSTLGDEKRLNPFLRVDQPDVGEAMGRSGRPPAEVFAALRARKDVFRG